MNFKLTWDDRVPKKTVSRWLDYYLLFAINKQGSAHLSSTSMTVTSKQGDKNE